MGKPVFVAPPKWRPPAPGEQPVLRPLNLGEKLDAGFKLWTRNFWTLLVPVLLFTAPLSVLSTLVQASIDEDAFDVGRETTTSNVGTQVAGQAAQIGLTAIAGVLATAAVVQAVSHAYTGGRPNWRSSMALALRRLPSLLWIGLLMLAAFAALAAPAAGLIALGGTAAIVAGAVLAVGALVVLTWLWVPWILAYVPLLVEDVRGTRALRRTMELVRDRWWRTFGTEIVLFTIVAIIGMPIAFLFGIVVGISAAVGEGSGELTAAVLMTVATILQNAVVLPLQAAVIVIIYFDLRVRREGFDLDVLMGQLGRPVPQPDGPPGWSGSGPAGPGPATPAHDPPRSGPPAAPPQDWRGFGPPQPPPQPPPASPSDGSGGPGS